MTDERDRLLGPEKCPRCLGLRARAERFVGWCPICLRWQSVGMSSFIIVPHAVYRHLSCVECRLAVWCRDLLLHPAAHACMYGSHAHEPGECPGAGPRITGVDRSCWRVWRTHAAGAAHAAERAPTEADEPGE